MHPLISRNHSLTGASYSKVQLRSVSTASFKEMQLGFMCKVKAGLKLACHLLAVTSSKSFHFFQFPTLGYNFTPGTVVLWEIKWKKGVVRRISKSEKWTYPARFSPCFPKTSSIDPNKHWELRPLQVSCNQVTAPSSLGKFRINAIVNTPKQLFKIMN